MSTKELAYQMTLYDWELFTSIHEVTKQWYNSIVTGMWSFKNYYNENKNKKRIMKKIRPSPPKNKQTNFLYIERLKKKVKKAVYWNKTQNANFESCCPEETRSAAAKLQTFNLFHWPQPRTFADRLQCLQWRDLTVITTILNGSHMHLIIMYVFNFRCLWGR